MTHLLQAEVINFSISVFIWAFDTAAAPHSSQRAVEHGNSKAGASKVQRVTFTGTEVNKSK